MIVKRRLLLIGILMVASVNSGAISAAPQLDPIAYISEIHGQTDIWLLDPNTGLDVNITDDEYVESSPSFSPTRDRIAYAVWQGGQSEIWAVNIATREKQKLLPFPGDAFKPAWSPDGRRVVFEGIRDGLYLYDLADQKLTRLARGFYESPCWMPNSNEVVAVHLKLSKDKTHPIYPIELINADNRRQKTLVEVQNGLLDAPTALSENELLFVYYADPPAIIARSSKGDVTPVISLSEHVWYPCFSRDGRYIVFTCDENEGANLWMANADGTNLRRLTVDHGVCSEPCW